MVASANPEQVMLNMAGPKIGRQRMAIAAEGAAAHSQLEIVRAPKSPEVLDLLGESTSLKADKYRFTTTMMASVRHHLETHAARHPNTVTYGRCRFPTDEFLASCASAAVLQCLLLLYVLHHHPYMSVVPCAFASCCLAQHVSS